MIPLSRPASPVAALPASAPGGQLVCTSPPFNITRNVLHPHEGGAVKHLHGAADRKVRLINLAAVLVPFAGLIAAGLKGVEDELDLIPPFSGDAYHAENLPDVPKTLREATMALDKSVMLREALGGQVVDHYVHTARWEQFEYGRRVTDWELKRGFERY